MTREVVVVPSRAFRAGEVIFRQDDAMTGEAYLVHEGKIQVRQRIDGEERVIRTLAKGDLLGEVALFRAAPHSATAVAVEAVTLLVIAADRLEEMIRAHPGLAMALIRQLARMAAREDSSGAPR